ncbi:HpcH/HpaI aldolase family protein [Ancylobacter sp. VNQ12]|uniref:HpcH/HpaI aldolase family protein n=1 Tax=Ancylobacter sp. VNQ12 TaxID=3400920 RepID=UPI003C04617C
MELPVNHFKRGIHAGEQQLGLWCSLASNLTVEILAGSGYDWLLIDTEHSPNELNMVFSQLQACMENKVQPIVRPPVTDAVWAKRYLDAGVQSFLFPMVETAEQAAAAVAYTRYPPEGIRGFASASRASRFGRVKDYYSRAHEEICVLVQIESRLGMENLEAICGVPGIDGVFIGPGDLSADIGYLGDQGNEAVVTLIEGLVGRIVKAGNRAGILTGDEALARRYIAAGNIFTAVGSDAGVLARGSEALARRFRG